MLRVGSRLVDLPGRRVLHGVDPVHLEPQAFDVLAHLVEHRSRVVPREELLDTVWGDRFVSDSALATRIKEIRRALGDDGDAQAVVRTVRGRGYQLVASVADLSDPGVVAQPARPDLVGRDGDVEALLERLAPGAVLTLVGPGGVGKSTLVRALGAAVRAQGLPVAYADLTALGSAEQLVPALLHATGLQPDGEDDAVALLAVWPGVLVLDDADDMVAEVAALATGVTVPGSLVRTVVTCRERLHVARERVWPVLGLAPASARVLLRARAVDVDPRSPLASAADDELDALADAVDRLPLALQMLASMSAVLDVDQLHSLVAARADLVTSTDRDVPERHRSLSRLVADSLRRLEPDDLSALTTLSAFAGSFAVDDAMALLGTGDPLGRLRSITDRSLVATTASVDGRRLQVLRTVRRSLASVAGEEALDGAARDHAVFVADALAGADARLAGPAEAAAAVRIAALVDDARAAHTWARDRDPALASSLVASLHLYAYARLWSEPAAWAAASSARSPAESAVLATAAAQEGRLDEARRLAEPMLDDERWRGRALETLSDVAIYQGRVDDAEALSAAAVAEGRRRDDARLVAIGTTNLSLAATFGGRPAEGLVALREADSVHDLLAPTERAWLRYAEGEALAASDDDAAAACFRGAVVEASSVGSRFVLGVARSALASVLARSDRPLEAAAEFAAVIDEYLRRGNVTHLTSALRNAVPLLEVLGRDHESYVVGVWTLEGRARRGYGADVDAVRGALAAISTRTAGELEAEWRAEGRRLTPTQAAALANQGLRHDGRGISV